jgi:hypothetical protein
MTTFNALPFDILSRILEYNAQPDISSLSLGCKQNSADIKSIGELNQKKRIREKTNFIKTLGLYVDKYNNDSEQYGFDIPKIKEYFKSSHLNDKSLVVNGTNDFAVDGKMVNITSNKSSHIENQIGTVIEFIPECVYNLIESMAYRDSNNTEILLDGMIIYNSDRGELSNNNMVYILINNENIERGYKSQYEKYQGKPVTVVLGPNVTSIGNNAFYCCKSLTSVVIGNSVTSIGDGAFRRCTSLTSVVIPDSVTSIGIAAFYDCISLTSVVIPDSVTSIGDGAFSNCSSLTSVVIPDSVQSIEKEAFYNCSSLTMVIIPDSVKSIGDNAFVNCKSLTSIVIPNSVTSIDSNAFYSCTSLTSIVIPNSVTSIDSNAFYSCTSLTSIVIPNSVTSIGRDAFCDNAKIIRR